ncbi:hypothetical protein DL96DRAFT_1678091 [Flagelloscypha sp. PMI_526]|nr:hypothetical protein DL96DRAFT_1678091 [Flagelloscypha sp. PMI_526]
MATIRIHRKSRTGCLNCKRRKVKCDETGHPTCQNCQKRRATCEWPGAMDSVGCSQRSSGQSQMSLSTHYRYSPCSPTHIMEPPHNFDMATLELFCHLTTEMTVSLLNCDGPYAQLYRTYEHTIPKLAFAHPFLMHSLLSLAALNLHRLSKDKLGPRDHYSLSQYHFRHAAASLPKLCQDRNCTSIGHSCNQLATAQLISNGILSIVSLSNLSSNATDQSTRSQLKAWIDWIEARKKLTSGFFRVHAQKLLNGPLSQLIKRSTHFVTEAHESKTFQSPTPSIPGVPVFPTFLSTIHIPSDGSSDDFELLEPGTAEAYREAVDALQFVFFLFSLGGCSPAFDAWFGMISSSYMELLQKQRPRALVILAVFWALFKAALARPGHAIWWEPSVAQGSGQQVDWVLKIREVLSADWQTYLDICLRWCNGTAAEKEWDLHVTGSDVLEDWSEQVVG